MQRRANQNHRLRGGREWSRWDIYDIGVEVEAVQENNLRLRETEGMYEVIEAV